MKKHSKVSIIIPVYVKTPYFFESVRECLKLEYPSFEILIIVDAKTKVSFSDKKVRVLRTGRSRTGPGEKRDRGILKATGDFIAFLDDDSYPAIDWLKEAVRVLYKEKVGAVCGPGLTPPADSFSQKITGAVLASPFGSGPYFYRFAKGGPRFVDDYPAYNLIIKRDGLLKIGGFGTKFYGGEDTTLCLKLINTGEKIYYHPDVIVYHHRRKFPFEYMRQVGNVGLHRGYFVKTFPQTSLRPSYFGPALLTMGLPVLLIWLFSNQSIATWFLGGLIAAYLTIFVHSLRQNSLGISVLLPFAILLNHLTYGVQFSRGLMTKKLKR